MLSSRFVKFSEITRSSHKQAVRLLSSICYYDERSVFKKNLTNIAKDCEIEVCKLTPNIVKTNMQYVKTPIEDEWRIPLLQNLIRIRTNEWTLPGFDHKEFNLLINDVCTT